jgi:hypothetical protein
MRLALERLTGPLLGWIPDVNDVPRSRQVALGAVVSVVVHLLILLLFVGAALVFPERVEPPPMAQKPSVELTVVPMANAAPEPRLRPPARHFVDANGLKAGERPKEATLEADRDMTEASELPARGESPLPTQDGETLPFMRDFANQEIRLGAEDNAARAESARAEAAQQPQPQAPQTATVAPMYAPQPVEKEALAAAEKAKPQEKLPEPAKQARATPLPKVAKPDETQLAMAKTQPEAAPAPAQPVEKAETRPMPNQYASFSTPKPMTGPSIADRYKEELRKTKNEGRISTRGVSGVNAINTPAGRWRKRMFEAMKQNWSMFVQQNPDLVTIGTVRVKFVIAREGGKASQVRVDAEGGNYTSAEVCRRAVIETPIPQPPADLFENLEGEKLEAEVIFTLY